MEDKPLVSFCLFTYNQENFVRDALQGALSQDYDNMEIVVSDDCSTDKTYDVIKEILKNYHGSHKIVINRNEHNLGIAGNVNKVLYTIAKGEIIVLAAGDDVSMPTRVSVSVDFLQLHPEVTSLSFASVLVDKNLNKIPASPGRLLNIKNNTILTLEDYVYNCFSFLLFSGDSRVLRRSVIDAFPPLEYVEAEDIYLFIRSLYIGSIAYIRQPLVLYRQHNDSVMNKERNKTLEEKKKDREEYEDKKDVRKQLEADLDWAIKHNYVSSEQK